MTMEAEGIPPLFVLQTHCKPAVRRLRRAAVESVRTGRIMGV
ncbi:hypothetical protein ANACOL_03701 [Anaerotruncus colihominis DSM 17241]|uniref:Uncharacterized protein n=1 Tax=Anaerotruncus colihominis DSM 17241 TaxID=445972 RepID=B0PFW9_9FIRM|nr:hypothetical protein ANACOL_03701 [Anaerotruncus colihominis DSM 17241]